MDNTCSFSDLFWNFCIVIEIGSSASEQSSEIVKIKISDDDEKSIAIDI